MDFLRAGEVLLRSSQPLLPFLAPSVCRSRRIPTLSRHHPHKVQYQPSRAFAASHSAQQQNAAAAKESNDSAQPATSSVTDEFSRLLDSAISGDKGVPTAPTGRTSRFKTPSAQDNNSPARRVVRAQQQQQNLSSPNSSSSSTPPTNRSRNDGNSISELFDAMLSTPTRPQNQNRLPPHSRSSNPDSSVLAGALDPLGFVSQFTSPAPPPPATPQIAPMKLNSSLGRTIPVDAARGMDVARAFRALEMQCARNSVRRDFMRQRFHERPGLKRKRLKSERWRRRFKEGFRETVRMVQRLKGQGW